MGEHRSPARLKASTENQREKALQFFPPSLSDKWFLGSEGHEHSPFEHVVFYRVISVLPTNPIRMRCIVLNAPLRTVNAAHFVFMSSCSVSMHNTKQLAEERKLLRVCKPYLLHFTHLMLLLTLLLSITLTQLQRLHSNLSSRCMGAMYMHIMYSEKCPGLQLHEKKHRVD